MKVRNLCRWFLATCLLFFISFEGQAQQSRQTLRQFLHGQVRPAVLNGKATLAGILPPSQQMQLSIVLPLRNQAELASLLNRLYDPSNSDYRKFLTTAQFADEFAPTAADYQAVVAYARANGFAVGAAPANRMLVPISGTAAQVEKAFNVRMGLYRHPTEQRLFFSPDRQPSLNLSVPVANIAGLDNYSAPKPLYTHPAPQAPANLATANQDAASRGDANQGSPSQGSTGQALTGSGPGGSFLASDIRAAYYGGTTLTGTGQTVALLEFDGYDPNDVQMTLASVGQSSNVPIHNVLLDGATGESISGDDSEEVIDIVQALGMAPGLSQVRVYIGSNDVDILNAIASENLAQEVSISWTWSPDDPETDEIFFEEMAAQGQSVFAASGDWGEFDPYFDNFYPAEDAYVTAAGGTVLTTSGTGQAWTAETAWNRSGGGISPDGIAMPGWQSGIATSTNGGSATLRNVPDVAAEANTDNYVCTMGACTGNYGGTSFSAPRWAGFMALVNQQAAQQGQPPVGFLNPTLYALGTGSDYTSQFHDIVLGNNDARGNCCGWPYYNAVPGYDLVTGWGSPAGQNLIDALAPQSQAVFQLASSASALTLAPNGSVKTAITVKAGTGFSGSVNLAISGLPSGVTASWSANPIADSSVLTLSADNTGVRGAYLITITGTANGVTESTSVALSIDAPGFTLVPSPANLKIYPGTSGSVSLLVNDAAGFNGSVHLAVTSGLPAGFTASWVANPTTGASSLTLTASDSVAPNTDAIVTITGTSGNLTATTTLALVVSPPVFYLNLSPYPTTIAQGATVTATVSAVPVDKFTDTITLTAPELPPGVTAAFNPPSITLGQTSTLTLKASQSAAPGSAFAGIEARGSAADTISQFNVAVTQKPTPSFTLTPAASAITLVQNTAASDAILVNAQNAFSGSVSLAITSGLPGGVTASFAPSTTSGSTQLLLSAGSTATAGFYTLWITGTSGSQTATASIFLRVDPPPTFTLQALPTAIRVTQGSTITDAITAVPQPGFTGSVNLALVSALPAGLTASLSNSTNGTAVLTVGVGDSVPVGTYSVTIAGVSGDRTVTATIPLSVLAAPTVATSTALSITPGGGTLTTGSSFTLTAVVTPASGTAVPAGNVVFSIGGATSSVALNSSGVATYSGTAPAAGTLTLSAAYQGAAGFTASTSNTLQETVAAATSPAFALAATSVTITAGATTGNTSTITLTPAGGFTGAVDLTASIVSGPAGATSRPTLSFGSAGSVAVHGNGPVTAILTIATQARNSTTAEAGHSSAPWCATGYAPGGAALACLLLFGIPSRRRAWRAFLGMAVLFCMLASGAVACSGTLMATGTQSNTGTTPGLYTITVTGVSGAASASTNIVLTVE